MFKKFKSFVALFLMSTGTPRRAVIRSAILGGVALFSIVLPEAFTVFGVKVTEFKNDVLVVFGCFIYFIAAADFIGAIFLIHPKVRKWCREKTKKHK